MRTLLSAGNDHSLIFNFTVIQPMPFSFFSGLHFRLTADAKMKRVLVFT